MAEKTEFLRAIDDAILDADSLEKFINGSDSETVLTRLSKRYPTLQKALKELFANAGIAGRFKTLAELQASSLVNGAYALVADDVTEKNGIYTKEGGAWVKSKYDPLLKSLNYTDDRLNEITENVNISSQALIVKSSDDAVLATVTSSGEVTANDFVTDDGRLSDALKIKNNVESKELLIAEATTSSDGFVLHGVYSNGDVESPHPPIQGFGIDAIKNQLLDSEGLNKAGIYLDRVGSQHLKPMNFDVLVAEHAEGGFGHCRMGSMYQVSDNRFYVAYTQFKVTGTDQAGGRLYAKFVDVDFENKSATVGDPILLHEGFDNGEHPPAQPQFIKCKDGVLLIYNEDHDFVVYKSKDDCQTWEEISRVDPKILLVDAPNKTFWLALDGVVRIPDGLYKDRIVACGFSFGYVSGGDMHLVSMYSDDEGVTWTLGYNYKPSVDLGWTKEMNETGVSLDTENNLVMIVRNEQLEVRKLYLAKSVDGGQSMQPYTRGANVFAVRCQTGNIQWSPRNNGGVPKIVLCMPSDWSRNGLVLRLSYDNLKSIAHSYQLVNKSVTSGYSSVKRLDAHTYGIVYEYGGFNAKSSIAIRFINNKEIYS